MSESEKHSARGNDSNVPAKSKENPSRLCPVQDELEGIRQSLPYLRGESLTLFFNRMRELEQSLDHNKAHTSENEDCYAIQEELDGMRKSLVHLHGKSLTLYLTRMRELEKSLEHRKIQKEVEEMKKDVSKGIDEMKEIISKVKTEMKGNIEEISLKLMEEIAVMKEDIEELKSEDG